MGEGFWHVSLTYMYLLVDIAKTSCLSIVNDLSRKIWSGAKNGLRTVFAAKNGPRTKLALQNLVHVGKFSLLVY